MALQFCVVASGSDGNAIWVRSSNTEILLDCGIAFRDLTAGLATINTSIDRLNAVVCTHHHGDHSAGIPRLAKQGVPVYASDATLLHLKHSVSDENRRCLNIGRRSDIGDLRIRAVPTSHDAPGSIAVVVSDGISALGLATDLGCKTKQLVQAFSNLDAVILESNHDIDMLRFGPYPPQLKRRILGPTGHLSNDDAADLISDIAHAGLRHIWLVHLSEENNTPERASEVVGPVVAAYAPHATLAVARRDSMAHPVTLRGTGPLFARVRQAGDSIAGGR